MHSSQQPEDSLEQLQLTAALTKQKSRTPLFCKFWETLKRGRSKFCSLGWIFTLKQDGTGHTHTTTVRCLISIFPTTFYLYYHRHHSNLRSNEHVALEKKTHMHIHAHVQNGTCANKDEHAHRLMKRWVWVDEKTSAGRERIQGRI